MTSFCRIALGLVTLLSPLLSGTVKGGSLRNTRPNIVFIMTDDQGMNLSYMGHPYLRTPHIDAFAGKSLRFTNYYVSPNCSPTRAAILTGAHEFRGAVTATHSGMERLALDLTLFPELLRKGGYATGIFGKWHLGDLGPHRPGNRGFSEVLMHGAGGIGQRGEGNKFHADFPPNQGKGDKAAYFNPVLLHNDTIVQTRGYCTDIFFRAALGWMRTQHGAGKPYFAFISTNTPHSPLIAPKEDLDRMTNRGVKADKRMAMIENIDDNFGLMMAKLNEWEMLDNTLVIFTTDNGAPHKPGSTAFNAGHKTGKGTPYEGGVHVPCFWFWQGHLEEGRDIPALTAHIDLYRTFCELAGVDAEQAAQKLEGRSLLPLLEDADAPWAPRALHTQRGNLGTDPRKAADKMWSVRTDRWRLVGRELYDIRSDPHEDHDVAAQYPEVVQKLAKLHFQWYGTMTPCMINQNNTWEGPAPMEMLYDRQKRVRGIPDWMPPEI